MALKIPSYRSRLFLNSGTSTLSPFSHSPSSLSIPTTSITSHSLFKMFSKPSNVRTRGRIRVRRRASGLVSAALDLTEDNVRQVLEDARTEFGQIFDTSVGMTGVAELAEVDGPFVKIRLSGRFWHERSLVIARLGNYLKQKIPEILEVEVEDEKQLDDSPANF